MLIDVRSRPEDESRTTAVLGVLALLSLVSLGFRAERFPAILEANGATITLQDALFIALLIGGARSLAGWANANRLTSGFLVVFLAGVCVSALRSPLGEPAIVAVGKYIEFVLSGVAIGLALLRHARPDLMSRALTGALAINVAVALGRLADHPGGLLTGRSDGLLGYENFASLAGVTSIWCALRVRRVQDRAEHMTCLGGLVLGAVAFALAKSVLLVGVGVAFVILLPVLRSRWVRRGMLVGAVLILGLLIGRSEDLAGLFGSGERATAPAAPGLPAGGDRASFVLPYQPRVPDGLTSGSFAHRIAVGYLGLRIAIEAPLLGRGWLVTSNPGFIRTRHHDDVLLRRFSRLDPNLLITNSPTALHNGYLQLAAEAGWPTLLALMGLFGVALAPGLSMLRSMRSRTPVVVAAGIGWLALLAIFLSSSTLFGGQLETAALGLGLVFATSRPRPGADRRTVLVTTLVVLVTVSAFLLLILPLSEPRPEDPILRNRITQSGRLVDRAGFRVDGSLTLSNGLTAVRGTPLNLAITALPAASSTSRAVTVHARLPSFRSRSSQVIMNTGRVSMIEHRGSRVGEAVYVSIVRGVPGVFITLPPNAASVQLPGMEPQLSGARTVRGSFGAVGKAEPGILTHRTAKALVVVAAEAARIEGGRSATLTRYGRGVANRTIYVSPYPLAYAGGVRSAKGFRVERPGAYLVLRRTDRIARIRLRRAGTDPSWTRTAGTALPFMLEDRPHSGIAELSSLGAQYLGFVSNLIPKRPEEP